VEEVEDPANEIFAGKRLIFDKKASVGSWWRFDGDEKYGRTRGRRKHVIRQGIARAAANCCGEYQRRQHDIVTTTVLRGDARAAT
jgi:hypothetical protein